MGQILHGSATTTEAVRRAIQNSQASLRQLAGPSRRGNGSVVSHPQIDSREDGGDQTDEPMGAHRVGHGARIAQMPGAISPFLPLSEVDDASTATKATAAPTTTFLRPACNDGSSRSMILRPLCTSQRWISANPRKCHARPGSAPWHHQR